MTITPEQLADLRTGDVVDIDGTEQRRWILLRHGDGTLPGWCGREDARIELVEARDR